MPDMRDDLVGSCQDNQNFFQSKEVIVIVSKTEHYFKNYVIAFKTEHYLALAYGGVRD